MKLVTWNVNSIRARTARLAAWLERERPDVVCLQETKVEDAGFPFDLLRGAGYEVATFGQRTYNGVAIASNQPLTAVTREFGDPDDDGDARTIAATTHGVRVVCAYVPNGQDLTSDRYPYKLAWLRRLRRFLAAGAGDSPGQELVLCGDFNVTPDDRDVWSPEKWANQIHCSEPERAALREVLGADASDGGPQLVDTFRAVNGDAVAYSWWDYRGVAFFKDQGLRIDCIFATPALAARCTACAIDRTARKGQDASDHAPVLATFSA